MRGDACAKRQIPPAPNMVRSSRVPQRFIAASNNFGFRTTPPNSPAFLSSKYCLNFWYTSQQQAEVAELADARDSKSRSLGSVGSIPTFGTA